MRLLVVLGLFFASEVLLAQTVRISGNISGANSGIVSIKIDPYYIGDQPEVYEFKIINEAFSGELKLRKSQLVSIEHNNQSTDLFLEFGDQLVLSFSSKDLLNSLKVEGKGAANNTVLVEFNKSFKQQYYTKAIENEMLADRIDTYEMTLYDRKAQQKTFLEKQFKKYEVSGTFKNFIEQQVSYHYWYQLLAFPIIKGNNNKENLTVGEIPEVMLEKLNEVPLYNERAMMSSSYRQFLIYYNTYFTSKENGFNKFENYGQSLKSKFAYALKNMKGTPRLYTMSKFMYDNCDKVDTETLNDLKYKIEQLDTEGAYKQIVNDDCDQFVVKETKSKGSVASVKKDQGFTMTDVNGKEVYLSDFEGKVVYIDFWASWCGPCRQQFPFAKQLKDKFTDKEKKDIVFLYISIDANKETWKKSIEQQGIEGTHAISPGNWQSEVCKALGINSIPRYMLMDKKGNIAKSQASRPSDPAIYNDIKSLL